MLNRFNRSAPLALSTRVNAGGALNGLRTVDRHSRYLLCYSSASKLNRITGLPRGRWMKRRELLQLGIGGLAALGTKGSLSAAAQPGSGQGPPPPKPPAADGVVNLAAKTIEDWSEPWIWRPSEWPNQSLALNLVGNAHPPRATSTGNPYTPLFSFNGVSPGPTIRLRGNETAARHAAESSRAEHGASPERPGGRSVRSAPRCARGGVLPHAEGHGPAVYRAAPGERDLRPLP